MAPKMVMLYIYTITCIVIGTDLDRLEGHLADLGPSVDLGALLVALVPLADLVGVVKMISVSNNNLID